MTVDERVAVVMATVLSVMLGVGLGVIATSTRSSQGPQLPPEQPSTAAPAASATEPPRATFEATQPEPLPPPEPTSDRPVSFIDGTVRHADGTPAEGIRIAAAEQIGFMEGLLFQTGHRERATSGPDGGFRVRLDASVEAVTGLDLFVTAQTQGASTTIRTVIRGSPHGVPDLYLWDPQLTVNGDRVTWRPAPASGDGSGVDYDTTLTVTTGEEVGDPLTVTAGPDGARIDRRWLEDQPGALTVSAHAPANPAGQIADGGVTYSASMDITGPGAPPSRGLSCQVIDRASGVEATPQPCWLTDGDFAGHGRPASVAGCPEAGCNYDQAVLDLGAVVPLDLVLARGCAFGCTVHTSQDGVNWEALGGGLRQQFFEADGRSARWVRLSATLFFVTELSVLTGS